MNVAFPHDRGFILGVIIAALVPAFALAHAVVGRYKDERQRLAVEWRQRGERDLTGDPALAVVDFQTALAYGSDPATELRLAEALKAANRPAEAEAHLLTLWADEPGNGEMNLQLARVAGARGDLSAAVRYYHGAIDGAWEEHAGSSRREARLELARLLLANGQRTRAQAELIALIDDLPADADIVTEVGSLVLDAGAENRAIGLFQRALSLDPTNARASTLAGSVEFREGKYQLAHDYLAEAGKHAALKPDVQEMLDVSGRILVLDTTAGMSARGRTERVLRDLAIARARLERCAAGSTGDADTAARVAGLAARADAAAKLRQRAIERDPDLIDQLMALVFDIEALPAAVCGPDSIDDRALERLAARQRGRPR